MSLKSDLKDARKAVEKLNTYSTGLPKNSVETPMYLKLNAEANRAIRKLPRGLQSSVAVDLLGR